MGIEWLGTLKNCTIALTTADFSQKRINDPFWEVPMESISLIEEDVDMIWIDLVGLAKILSK